LLDQKVTKNQGLIKIGCVSNPEVSPRNTRHERLVQIQAFVVAVYCYAHAIRTYLRQEPLSYFSNAGPAEDSLLFLQHRGATVWLIAEFAGCRDRPKINFKTAVAEGKQRRHVCSKTPASRALRMLFQVFKPCFASLYRSLQMFKIYIKP